MEMKKGRVYKVLEEGFWMLGRCIKKPSLLDPIRCKANFIAGSTNIFHKNSVWCFKYSSIRTYRGATKEEIDWFEYCESRSTYVPFEEYVALFTIEYQIY